MTENKQTALDWLMMQLPVFIRVDLYEKELYQQAKAMEKEQQIEIYRLKAIIEFYEQGCGKEGCKATEPHVH